MHYGFSAAMKLTVLICLLQLFRVKALRLHEQCAKHLLTKYSPSTVGYTYEKDFDLPFDFFPSNISYYIINGDDWYKQVQVDTLVVSLAEPSTNFHKRFSFEEVLLVYRGEEGKIKELFKWLWSQYLVKVLMVTQKLEVYTHHALGQGKCVDASPVLLGFCNRLLDRLPEKFPNCSLRVLRNINPPFVVEAGNGIEETLLGIAASKLELHLSDLGYLGMKSGKVEVINNNADVIIGGFWYMIDSMGYINYFLQDEVNLFVSDTKPMHPWLNILRIFDCWTWAGIVITYILTSTVWHTVSEKKGDNSFMYILCTLVSSVRNVPKKPTMTFWTWALAAMIFRNAYSGLLVSFMFKAMPNKPLTIGDIPRLQYGTGISEWHVYLYEDAAKHNIILQDCSSDEEACYRRLIDGGFAYIGSKRKMMYFNRFQRLHVIEEWRNYVAFAMKPNSPFRQGFTKVLLQLFEAGVVEKLDVYRLRQFRTQKVHFRHVTMEHLYFIFALLLGGIAMSLIAFVLEALFIKQNICFK